MTEQTKNFLTFNFLDREPRSAALVLEEVDAGDAAAFFDRAPARLLAPVIGAMIPWSAARCIERMKTEQASGLLRALEYSDAVSILRLINEDARERILELSTQRFARSFRNSLIYPKDTVGAWMDVKIPSFQDSMPLRDVIRTLKRMPRADTHIFVTNTVKEFAGVVAVADLFRHDEHAALADIADRSVRPLSNRDSLHACNARAEWDRLTVLPVVGRKRNLLGGLSRTGLRKALLDQDVVIRIATPGSVLMQLLSAFVTVGEAFAKVTLLTDEQISAPATKETPRGKKRSNRNQ